MNYKMMQGNVLGK